MIELPRLDPPELAAAAALFRRRAPLRLDTEAGRLTLLPVLELEELGAPLALSLRLGEGWARLVTETDLAEALLAPALPGIELDGLDAELRSLLLELAAGPLVKAAEAALGRPVRLAEGAPASLPHAVRFQAELAGTAWPVRLELDLRGLEIVTRGFERLPTAPAGLAELPLPLSAEAGRTRLTPAELAAAAPGDLLLLEEAPVARGRLDLVLGGVIAMACELEGSSLVFSGETRRRMAEGTVAAAERLDEVPLELVFELGRMSLSLGELRTLAPGHVFALGRDLRHPVDVMLGGRKIGEGELVQVGERVGVRLRSLIPR